MTEILTPTPEDIIPAPGGPEPEVLNTVYVGSLRVTVRTPTSAQLALINRYARVIERTEAKAKGLQDKAQLDLLWRKALDSMSEALEIFEFLIVSEADRAEVQQAMRQGTVDFEDLGAVIKSLSTPDESTALVKQRKSSARPKR